MPTIPSRATALIPAPYTYPVILLTFLMSVLSASAQNAESALARIDRQRDLYPQERLHAVTDREMYCAGDTVWLRVFVTDASTLRQTSVSRYAYVELRTPFNGVSRRVRLLERAGVYAGYLPLAEDLPEGDYTLTAYTTFSENVGSEYFFRKPLRVLAPYSSRYVIEHGFTPAGEGEVRGSFRLRPLTGESMNYNVMSWETRDGRRQEMPDSKNGFSRKFSRSRGDDVVLVKFGDYARYIPIDYPVEKTEIRFYPEGGWLITGERCEVAFKATDETGRGVSATGVVRDDTGEEAAVFSTRHNGMGSFGFVPVAGRVYTAEYTGPEGVVRTAEVGSARAGGAALHYGSSGSRCFFSVAGGEGMDLELVVVTRGNGILAVPVSPDRPVSVDMESLPTGLYQGLLVSRGDSAVVSERLFFIGSDREPLKVGAMSTDSLSITLRAPSGTEGDCCVRVVSRDGGGTGGEADIRSQLLLQSELRGRIEDAGGYFRVGDREARRNLDLVMMVNGWSRYNLPEAILGKYAEPAIPLEVGQEITGQVRSRWRNRPLEGVMVCAISPKADFGTYAETDSAGMFRLNGFDLPEDTPFIFRAMNEKGGSEGNYDIYEDSFPDSSCLPPATGGHPGESDIAAFFRGSKWIMLDEIKVQAFSNDGGDIFESLSSYSRNSDDFDKQGISTIGQALLGIAGMIEKDGRLYWRNSPTVYYVDGTMFDPLTGGGSSFSFGVSRFAESMRRYPAGGPSMPAPASSPLGESNNNGTTPKLSEVEKIIPFGTIERIDFLRWAQTFIFGSGFKGGIIMITTKDGGDYDLKRQFELKDYLPLGYQQYKEYASPLLSAETDVYDLQTSPTLLWLPSVRFNDEGKSINLALPVDSDYYIDIQGLADGAIIYDSLNHH